jgi:PAS domain S-box-containing protein
MSTPNFEVATSPPNTPIHDNGGHVVQLYREERFLIDVLSRFIGGALAAGDAAVVVATKPHRADLEVRLEALGLNTTMATMEGRYVCLDATETLPKLMTNGFVDANCFNDIIGGVLRQVRSAVGKDHRIAAFGELVALLSSEGQTEEAIKLEKLWNNLAKSHSFSLLCAYPLTNFQDGKHIEPFMNMCGEHSEVLPTESYLELNSEGERLRNIARLQQRSQALEKELAFRESEEHFRLLVEAAQDYAIFMLDPEGKIKSWNVGAERIKGYRAEEIIGKHFSCFYPEEDLRNGKPQWELIIASKEGRFEDEGWRIRKDGSRFWANVIITSVRDQSGTLLGFAKVTRDFTERKRTEKALQEEVAERRHAQEQLFESEKSLRQLSLHLLRTQDEERRRIGRDLHDSLGQYLAVLKMKLVTLASCLEASEEPVSQEMEDCIRLTDDSIREVRTVSYLLYPPMLEEMGLTSAIPWYLDGFSARSGIKSAFTVETGFGRMPRDIELALFRVLQEGLTNVHRHSGSQTANVRLSVKDGMAILEIEDKGKGVASHTQQSGDDWTRSFGVGVRGMNERMRQLGGRLELTSDTNGTTLRAAVPVEENSTLPFA